MLSTMMYTSGNKAAIHGKEFLITNVPDICFSDKTYKNNMLLKNGWAATPEIKSAATIMGCTINICTINTSQ